MGDLIKPWVMATIFLFWLSPYNVYFNLEFIMFKHGTVPITNERTVNAVKKYKGFHLSYNPSSSHYGCATTAIVLRDSVFLVLNGNHKQALSDVADADGVSGCIDYFCKNIKQANLLGEHFIVAGVEKDLFSIRQAAIEAIGQSGVDMIVKAIEGLGESAWV